MPTVRLGGFLCYFVSYDCIEPPHIHLAKGRERQSPSVKFWLTPITIARNLGLNAGELRQAHRIVRENQALFLEMWHEHCNN